MVDVITRFKLETTQYDSRLRDASKSLADLTNHLSMAGKDFDRFAKENVQTAASLGKVASGATNLKEKLKDLVGAYNTVARAYNSLTKEQQSGDFGKALSESLQQLKGRITAAKQGLYDMGNQGKDTGGLMGILADKLTVNIDAMKLFSVGMATVKGALDVAKDAFFNNEEQLDEWGRVVESSHSLYQGFLNALNTGDISGFLQNIGSIVQAARDAYDALDALGTYNAFNQINVEKTRTGMSESIADYRMGQGSKEEVKAAGEAYKNELKDRQRLEREAYLAAVKEMAAQRGVSFEDLRDAMSGTYGHYQDLKNVQMTGTAVKYIPGAFPGMSGRYAEYKVAQNDQERLGEALRHLNDTELKSLQALGAQAEKTGNEIAQVDRSLARVLNGRGNTSGGNGGGKTKPAITPAPVVEGSLKDLNNQIKELRDAQANVTNAAEWQNFQAQIDAVANRIKGLKGELAAISVGGLSNAGGVSITGSITDSVAQEGKNLKTADLSKPIANLKIGNDGKDLTKQGKQAQQAWSLAAQAVSSVGDAFNSIEDPGVKAMGTITQAIASIALGFAQASVQAGDLGPFGWVAFLAAGAAALATTISTVHSLTNLSEGGFVPGRSFSGDNIKANGGALGLNAGELVLNTSQQNNLANALQGNRNDYAESRPYVTGEMIYLVLNNYMRRSGHGEILKVR